MRLKKRIEYKGSIFWKSKKREFGMEINFHRVLNTISNNGLKWIDLPRPTREDMGYLEKAFSFHDLNLEDSLSKTQLPKIDRYKDHMFIILHFPTKDKEKNMPKVSQLSIFLGTDYLVTIHQGELEPLIELFQVCSKDAKQRESLMGKTSGYLLHTIIDVLVDDLFHILMKIEEIWMRLKRQYLMPKYPKQEKFRF